MCSASLVCITLGQVKLKMRAIVAHIGFLTSLLLDDLSATCFCLVCVKRKSNSSFYQFAKKVNNLL